MGTHKDEEDNEEDKNGGLNNTEGEADEGAIIQDRETREGEKQKARRETRRESETRNKLYI